jgi:hypothetical protein
VERNGIHEVLGKPPGWKDDDDWLTWGVCEECHEDEERVKFHAQQHNRDMIIIEVDEDGGAAQVLFSEEFHQSSSTFKADVIQDIILALQPCTSNMFTRPTIAEQWLYRQRRNHQLTGQWSGRGRAEEARVLLQARLRDMWWHRPEMQ